MSNQAVRLWVGWASLLIGGGILAAPGFAARLFGMDGRINLARGLAVRDLIIGVGALTQRDATPWVWARGLSDGFDSLLLGIGAANGRFRRDRALIGSVFAACSAGAHLWMARQAAAKQHSS